MRDHHEVAEAEAEKLTAKTKRLAGRIRAVLPGAELRVEQWLLLTRDGPGSKIEPVRGVPVRTLKSLGEAFRSLPTIVLSPIQVDTLAAGDSVWTDEQRVAFAAAALEALAQMHGLTDENSVPVVHRNLSPETVLVAARNQPLFVGFHVSRLPATQTVGALAPSPPPGPWVAPEVQNDALAAASKKRTKLRRLGDYLERLVSTALDEGNPEGLDNPEIAGNCRHPAGFRSRPFVAGGTRPSRRCN